MKYFTISRNDNVTSSLARRTPLHRTSSLHQIDDDDDNTGSKAPKLKNWFQDASRMINKYVSFTLHRKDKTNNNKKEIIQRKSITYGERKPNNVSTEVEVIFKSKFHKRVKDSTGKFLRRSLALIAPKSRKSNIRPSHDKKHVRRKNKKEQSASLISVDDKYESSTREGKFLTEIKQLLTTHATLNQISGTKDQLSIISGRKSRQYGDLHDLLHVGKGNDYYKKLLPTEQVAALIRERGKRDSAGKLKNFLSSNISMKLGVSFSDSRKTSYSKNYNDQHIAKKASTKSTKDPTERVYAIKESQSWTSLSQSESVIETSNISHKMVKYKTGVIKKSSTLTSSKTTVMPLSIKYSNRSKTDQPHILSARDCSQTSTTSKTSQRSLRNQIPHLKKWFADKKTSASIASAKEKHSQGEQVVTPEYIVQSTKETDTGFITNSILPSPELNNYKSDEPPSETPEQLLVVHDPSASATISDTETQAKKVTETTDLNPTNSQKTLNRPSKTSIANKDVESQFPKEPSVLTIKSAQQTEDIPTSKDSLTSDSSKANSLAIREPKRKTDGQSNVVQTTYCVRSRTNKPRKSKENFEKQPPAQTKSKRSGKKWYASCKPSQTHSRSSSTLESSNVSSNRCSFEENSSNPPCHESIPASDRSSRRVTLSRSTRSSCRPSSTRRPRKTSSSPRTGRVSSCYPSRPSRNEVRLPQKQPRKTSRSSSCYTPSPRKSRARTTAPSRKTSSCSSCKSRRNEVKHPPKRPRKTSRSSSCYTPSPRNSRSRSPSRKTSSCSSCKSHRKTPSRGNCKQQAATRSRKTASCSSCCKSRRKTSSRGNCKQQGAARSHKGSSCMSCKSHRKQSKRSICSTGSKRKGHGQERIISNFKTNTLQRPPTVQPVLGMCTLSTCGSKLLEVKYSIVKISYFQEYTTYEMMKSSPVKPRNIPNYVEKIFVTKDDRTPEPWHI